MLKSALCPETQQQNSHGFLLQTIFFPKLRDNFAQILPSILLCFIHLTPPGSRDFLEGYGLRLLIHSTAQINTPSWATIQVWLCSGPRTPGCRGHPASPTSDFSTPVSSLKFSSQQHTTEWQRLPRAPGLPEYRWNTAEDPKMVGKRQVQRQRPEIV